MHVLVLAIDHRGCLFAELSLRWPRVDFLLRTAMSVEGRAAAVLAARAESAQEVQAIEEHFRQQAQADKPLPLLREDNVGLWHIVTAPGSANIMTAIAKHRGFLLDAVRVKEGIETWTVGVANKEQARTIVEALEPMGPLRIVSLVKGTFPDLQLTGAQARAMRAAVQGGYYEYPRKTTPMKLAKGLGVSKSTFIEHLRRAEAKVVLGAEWAFH